MAYLRKQGQIFHLIYCNENKERKSFSLKTTNKKTASTLLKQFNAQQITGLPFEIYSANFNYGVKMNEIKKLQSKLDNIQAIIEFLINDNLTRQLIKMHPDSFQIIFEKIKTLSMEDRFASLTLTQTKQIFEEFVIQTKQEVSEILKVRQINKVVKKKLNMNPIVKVVKEKLIVNQVYHSNENLIREVEILNNQLNVAHTQVKRLNKVKFAKIDYSKYALDINKIVKENLKKSGKPNYLKISKILGVNDKTAKEICKHFNIS